MIVSFRSEDPAFALGALLETRERLRSAGFSENIEEVSRLETGNFFDALKLSVEAAGIAVAVIQVLAPIVQGFLSQKNTNRLIIENHEFIVEVTIKEADEYRVKQIIKAIFAASKDL